MWADAIVTLIKLAVVIGVLLTTVPIMVWVERRGSALIQDRLGPNRVGPWGLLQPVVDAVKLITKENLVPDGVDRFLYMLAPAIALAVALSTFIVVPFGYGKGLTLFGYKVHGFIVAPDLNIGILYIFALAAFGIYSIVLAGWSSNNKYSLLGGIRSSSQMISYELAMTISVVGVMMASSSFRLDHIVMAQTGTWFGFIPKWNVFPQVIGAITFMVAAFAETNRLPFDLPEAEAELVAGYHTEYSSMKFASFFMAEYINLVTSSSLIVLLFFGGWTLPGVATPSGWVGAIFSLVVFAVKVAFFLWFFVWVRWTLPRFRFDQLMALGWKVMIPLAVVNFLWIGIAMARGIL
ncbi:MAG: NADH-quinone oxidoreductase subunit NuoH [Acidobacteria bacterium]|nr:NADH-quinone oxidoreductase subunit NuoH [Acidobacteriota bacterium]